MYSSGSYTKMKWGDGGCMHSDFHKPAQPWKKSEGLNNTCLWWHVWNDCLILRYAHLMAKLSQLKVCHRKVTSSSSG